MKRKHRLHIDVTFSKAINGREAAKGLQLLIDTNLDLKRRPIWATDDSPYVDKIIILERVKKCP